MFVLSPDITLGGAEQDPAAVGRDILAAVAEAFVDIDLAVFAGIQIVTPDVLLQLGAQRVRTAGIIDFLIDDGAGFHLK